jgi:hypothetical protein
VLLEMLLGERSWNEGPTAAQLIHDPAVRRQLPLPIFELLGQCLARTPVNRPTMAEVSAHIEEVYRELIGSQYRRTPTPARTQKPIDHYAPTSAGAGRLAVWGPEFWELMARAKTAGGSLPTLSAAAVPRQEQQSRDAWRISALNSYDASRTLLESRATREFPELWGHVVALLDEQALLRMEAGDVLGANRRV